MAARARLYFTENFSVNLDEIQSFLAAGGRPVFQRLLARLFDHICPQLAQFPRSGRPFLEHRAGSAEAQALLRDLQETLRAGDNLREFVVDDYVVLYLIRKTRIYFLAIKHHRQLSFDLRRFWT